MATTTLRDVEQWLAGKPADEILCWDAFENPWHGLMVRYYEDQGYTNVRQEYDRCVEDLRWSTIKDREYHGRPGRIIATFEPDLTRFVYCLAWTSHCYSPAAGGVLDYLRNGDWREGPESLKQYTYGWTAPALHNAHYDDPSRPIDLAWKHLEHITIRDKAYPLYLTVVPAVFWHNKGKTWRSVELNVFRSEWLELEELEFQKPSMGYWQKCTAIARQWIRADSRLEDGESITLRLFDQTVGTWQRQGEILVRQ